MFDQINGSSLDKNTNVKMYVIKKNEKKNSILLVIDHSVLYVKLSCNYELETNYYNFLLQFSPLISA